jgi:UDP-3-O-[3-hydroxymyristoyl] glucosamine N-acyltransferase
MIVNYKNPDGSAVTMVTGREVTIGHNVTICHRVSIGSNVQIGDDVKLGTGCVVHSDLRIPDGVRVKARTTVTKYNVSELAPGVKKGCSTVVDGKRLYGIDALRAMGKI